MHGKRLDALWKVSTISSLNEDGMTRALLTFASGALRPGVAFTALLHRLDGNALVVEETILREGDPAAAACFKSPGSFVDLEASALCEIVRTWSTHASSDLAAVEGVSGREDVARTGMRAFIGTAFRAGDTIYTVSLVSRRPLGRPFDSEDSHFIESLATLLEKKLERRLQRARMLARAEADRTAALTAVPRQRKAAR